ncbi:MAG: hypothetical protein M3680_08780, partial [Myxococcota bacterium]|nr:hypothetical protein [Myxococcota bacterium]
MASRVGGAVTALISAALLAGSLATATWWAGHPTINGATRRMQEVFVGLYGAELCNTGGDGTCKAMPLPAGFEMTAWGALAIGGLLLLGTLMIAVLVIARSERRKTFAKLCLALSVLGALAAGALVLQGPSTQADVPIGYGMYLFWGGAALSMIASMLALRAMPKPRMQLAPARQSLPNMTGAPPSGLDVHALTSGESLRPPAIPSEPATQAPAPAAVQSPGGVLAGPSGPLGASGHGGTAPLFAAAPQLRPLYE